MNNYGMRKIVITVAVLAAVSLGIAGIISATSGIFSKNGIIAPGDGITIDEEKVFSIGGVDSLNVFSTSADIQFKESSGDTVRFHLHGKVRTTNEKNITKLAERKSGNTLEVGAEPPKGLIGMYSSTLNLDVYLPALYQGNVDAHSVSGDVSLPFGQFADLSMDTTSGEIDFRNVTAEALKVDSTSGDIKGTVDVAGAANIETTSGEIDIEGSAISLVAGSTSGDVSFDLNGAHEGIEIEATSGEVKLTLPKGSTFDMSLKTISGDLTSDFPVTIQGTQGSPGNRRLEGKVGDGGPEVTIKTVSGDISVSQR